MTIKTKEQKKKNKYGFRWSQDILRVLWYMGAGVSLVKFKWYLGLPLMFIFFILAQLTENLNTEIKQI